MPRSNVNLTPVLLNFVQQQVESGHYNTNSEVHSKGGEKAKARAAIARNFFFQSIGKGAKTSDPCPPCKGESHPYRFEIRTRKKRFTVLELKRPGWVAVQETMSLLDSKRTSCGPEPSLGITTT